MVLCKLFFTTAKQFLVLFHVSFYFSELLQQLVVLQDFQIFHVIVSLIITLELFLGFPWVDTLQDAKPSEVFEGDLHSSNSI